MLSTELNAARRRIAAAYDPALLESAGHRLAELLAGHFSRVQAGEGPVSNWQDPQQLVRQVQATLHPTPSATTAVDRFGELVQQALSHVQNLHHPHYVGHQVPASVPLAGLFDAIGSITNNPMTIYEMGPWSTAAERALVQELASLIDWRDRDYGGVVTHGGSVANLTALLVARNIVLPESWREGVPRTGPQPALVVQADAHYCIARAAGVLGLGTQNLIKVPLDSRRRMDVQQLDAILTGLRRDGRPVIAAVACACATPTGAFDPLNDVAGVCARHDVWLHVDAAHGAAVLMSARHRHLVAGLERADSLTWDAHKMLFVPALCAFIFYKNRRDSYAAFQQDAPYLFDPAAPVSGREEFDGALRTLECTKRAAALGLWGVWSLFGPQLFADLVEVTFDLTRTFYEKLSAAPDFRPLHEPQCNIQVFQHIPASLRDASPDRIGDFQRSVRRAVVESGKFYLVQTTIDGVTALRTTLINPLTTESDLDELLETLRETGRRMTKSQ